MIDNEMADAGAKIDYPLAETKKAGCIDQDRTTFIEKAVPPPPVDGTGSSPAAVSSTTRLEPLERESRPAVERLPYWPRFAINDAIAATTVTIVVLALAVLFVPRQVVTDPIYRTAVPSPDWLYLFYWLPYLHVQGVAQLTALFLIPPLIIVGLVILPFLQRDRVATEQRRRRRKVIVLALSALVLGTLFTATAYNGSRVPAQGCEACHRPRMVGVPPVEIKAFGNRDLAWLAKHLVDPQYWWLH